MSQNLRVSPQLILSISDHIQRKKMQQPNEPKRVVGVILGYRLAHQLLLKQSFEINAKINPKTLEIEQIDEVTLKQMLGLVKTSIEGNLYKDIELIGWYSTAPSCKPYSGDKVINQQVSKFMNEGKGNEQAENMKENALYLCIDFTNLKDNLSMKAFTLKQENQNYEWEEANYQVEVEKSETICIETAQNQFVPGEGSQFLNNLNMTVTAVKIFDVKIQQLLAIIEKNPQIQSNLLLMRELNQILNQISIQYYQSFSDELIQQYSDTNITSFLTAITTLDKLIQNVNSLKLNYLKQKMDSF